MSEIPMHTDTTFLYRIENPNIPARPDGVVSHAQIVGQWFTPDPTAVIQYLKKSQKLPGAQLVVAEIPAAELNAYHVSVHPIASQMDVEPDNYLIPRDDSVHTAVIALDVLVGGLNPNNATQRLKALDRILHVLGELSLLPAHTDSK